MPNRITENDRIIFVHILHTAGNCRAHIRVILLLICATICIICQVCLCVWIFRYNLVTISS